MICLDCTVNDTRGTHKLCFECNPALHGEARKYYAGCRCSECRHAALDQEHLRAAGRSPTSASHGTPQRYRNGCRCEPCASASRRHRHLIPHGMTPAIYQALLDIEDDSCPLCGIRQEDTDLVFHIDHSHNCAHTNRKISCSQCWRGLLCQGCNPHLERKIGHAYLREIEGLPPTKEDKRVLEYIRNPPANQLRERQSL